MKLSMIETFEIVGKSRRLLRSISGLAAILFIFAVLISIKQHLWTAGVY